MVFFSRKEKRLWCSHLNTWRWCLWSRVLPTIVGTKRLEPDTGQGGKMDKDTSGQSFTVTNLEILTPVGKQLHSNVAPQKFHLQNYRLHLTDMLAFRQQGVFLFSQIPSPSPLCCLKVKKGLFTRIPLWKTIVAAICGSLNEKCLP